MKGTGTKRVCEAVNIWLSCLILLLLTITTTTTFSLQSASAQTAPSSAGSSTGQAAPMNVGRTSVATMRDQYIQGYPEVSFLRDSDQRDANNNPIPGYVNPAQVTGAGPFGTMYPPTPAAAMGFPTESKLMQGLYMAGLNQLGGFNGQTNSDLKSYTQELQAGDFMARTLQYPPNVANQSKAQTLGQAQAMTNAMGDISKSQSASAMSYCSSFLQNFTVADGNLWNKIRNGLFVPIAILLLLPGAILTQVKATMACGNPALSEMGQMNPLEGLLRAVVAIFLIPGTYLVVNYGIDFSNSVTYSIAQAYTSIMGTNMYVDALASEVRAFPVRTPKENQNSGTPSLWPQTAVNSVASFEQNYIMNKIEDPSLNIDIVPPNLTDDAMPSGAAAAREISFGANAALTAGWNVLCAFQMAYLAYLFFVGPVVAALWVWPMAHFREALPNWIEGVITICFWSMFWNTAILLMACFKGVDEIGTMITSALNFLAVSSVKYAFDFAGLVREAGQEAAKKATEQKGGGGQKGAGGQQGKSGSHGAGGQHAGAPGAHPAHGLLNHGSPAHSPSGALASAKVGAETPAGPGYSGAGAAKGGLGGTHGSLAADLALPPLALGAKSGANSIHSQNTSMGNYTLSRGVDEHGNQVAMLKDAKGNTIAHLPANMRDGQSVATSDGGKVTFNRNGEGSSYTLSTASGQTFSAHISDVNPGAACGAPPMAGALDPHGAAGKNSIALRSQDGTMLLENNGNTLLTPRADGKGYDTYSLDQGASQGTFAMADGRSLTMSRDAGGSEQIAITNPANGQSESFSVAPGAQGGFDIGHAINGNQAGFAKVALDGDATVYSNYDNRGALLDRDAVSGNNIASTFFDPNSGQVLGNVVSSYQENGNSQTSYYGADGALTASTQHMYKEGGGSLDFVRDGNGQLLSSQDMSFTPDGGYTLETAKYADGALASAQMATFDSSSNLISAVPVDLPRTAVDATYCSADPALFGSTDYAVDASTFAPVAAGYAVDASTFASGGACYATDGSSIGAVPAGYGVDGFSPAYPQEWYQQANSGQPVNLSDVGAVVDNGCTVPVPGNTALSEFAPIVDSAPTVQTASCEAGFGGSTQPAIFDANSTWIAGGAAELPRAAIDSGACTVDSGSYGPSGFAVDGATFASAGACYAIDGASIAQVSSGYAVDGQSIGAAPQGYAADGATSAPAQACYAVDPSSIAPVSAGYAADDSSFASCPAGYAADGSAIAPGPNACTVDGTSISYPQEWYQQSIAGQPLNSSDFAPVQDPGQAFSAAGCESGFGGGAQMADFAASAGSAGSSQVELPRAACEQNLSAAEPIATVPAGYAVDSPSLASASCPVDGSTVAAGPAAWSVDSPSVAADNAGFAVAGSPADSGSAACTVNESSVAYPQEWYQEASAGQPLSSSDFAPVADQSATAPMAGCEARSDYGYVADAAQTMPAASCDAGFAGNAQTATFAANSDAICTGPAELPRFSPEPNLCAPYPAFESEAQAAGCAPSELARSTTETAPEVAAFTERLAQAVEQATHNTNFDCRQTTDVDTTQQVEQSNVYAQREPAKACDFLIGEQPWQQVASAVVPAAIAARTRPAQAPAGRAPAPVRMRAAAPPENNAVRSTHERMAPPLFVKPSTKGERTVNLPPSYMHKAGLTDEQQATATSLSSNQESLQQQLLSLNNQPRAKTIKEILKGALPSADTEEALANAHINYTLICSLLSRGRAYQAQELLNIVVHDIEMISHMQEAKPLIESYVQLLQRHHMVEQAQVFQIHLQNASTGSNSLSGAW